MTEILDPPNAPLAGRYDLERELGRGGMATVYYSRDLKHGREVAVKILHAELAAAVGSERFLREIEITAGLNHPHILPLLDSGEAGGLLYYVMPFVAGGSLRRYLSPDAPLPLDRVLRITGEVASALDYAHGRGVVHRDIKPENILFSEGLAVVADFGIARAVTGAARRGLTRTGVPLGTPGYMSPEQALGTGTLDTRTDVYSLGCVVYEMLVGWTPACWPGTDDVRLGRLSELPPEHRDRLDALPGRIEQALTRALALRPADRFATPGDLAAALIESSARTPRLSEDEVHRLIGRAAELQARQPTGEVALSLGSVEQVAAEVGIPPDHVRRAARELRREEPSAPAATRYAPSGFDPRKSRITHERTVEGELPRSAYAGLVEEIQTQLETVGHVSLLGGTLTWSPATQTEESRKVVVTVSPRAGATQIRVEERLEISGWRKAVLPFGAVTSAAIAMSFLHAIAPPEPVAAVVAIAAAAAGLFFSARWIIWFEAQRLEPQLERLANSLAALAERSSTA